MPPEALALVFQMFGQLMLFDFFLYSYKKYYVNVLINLAKFNSSPCMPTTDIHSHVYTKSNELPDIFFLCSASTIFASGSQNTKMLFLNFVSPIPLSILK